MSRNRLILSLYYLKWECSLFYETSSARISHISLLYFLELSRESGKGKISLQPLFFFPPHKNSSAYPMVTSHFNNQQILQDEEVVNSTNTCCFREMRIRVSDFCLVGGSFVCLGWLFCLFVWGFHFGLVWFFCRFLCPTVIDELRNVKMVPPVGSFFRALWIPTLICCLPFSRCCSTVLFWSLKNTCYHVAFKRLILILLPSSSTIGIDSSLIHRELLVLGMLYMGEAGGQDKSGFKSKGKQELWKPQLQEASACY